MKNEERVALLLVNKLVSRNKGGREAYTLLANAPNLDVVIPKLFGVIASTERFEDQWNPKRQVVSDKIVTAAMLAFPSEAHTIVRRVADLDPLHDRHTLKTSVVGSIYGINTIEFHKVVCDRIEVETAVCHLIVSVLTSPITYMENFTSEFEGRLSNVARDYVLGSVTNQRRRRSIAEILKKALEVPADCDDSFVRLLIGEFTYKAFAIVPDEDQLAFVQTVIDGNGHLVNK